MNKENNRNAAGLRRSAIAERIRLREEWSALKEIDSPSDRQNVLNKKQTNTKVAKKLAPVKEVMKAPSCVPGRLNRQSNTRSQPDALRGVVALVEVGSEGKALPLRAALTALGASVVPVWSPLITHLVWAQGGCRSTRARARALACSLVSPLWVEACAASARRLPSRAFPAAARPSDLPSPATLRQMLKKAEADNLSFGNLLTDGHEKDKVPRLRISSETEQDTSADTSRDTSKDTSRDTSKDTTTDIESRVNTAPRRALPKSSSSMSPPPVIKSRRKLFTHKQTEIAKSSDDEDENTQSRLNIPKPNKQLKKPVPTCDRKGLARAERMAKRFLAACTGNTLKTAITQPTHRIVLTGMTSTERREITAAILSLKGRIQKCVNKRTTHVILGTFQHATDNDRTAITGITNLSQDTLSRVVHRSDVQKARTVSSLCGAARGCRVLRARWALDSANSNKWLHHSGYEVPHLKKMSQKARVERTALARLRSDYAYDVFCGMRVFVTNSAEQRDAAIQLLNLCGAVIQNGGIQDGAHKIQHGQGLTQIKRPLGHKTQALTQKTQHVLVTEKGEIRYGLVDNTNEFDIKIGVAIGEVSSKWVFDSVAAARMRSTRRYVNKDVSGASVVAEEMANFFIDD